MLLYLSQIQLYNGLGQLTGVNTLGPNDLGVAPRGIGHFIKNTGLISLLATRAAMHLNDLQQEHLYVCVRMLCGCVCAALTGVLEKSDHDVSLTNLGVLFQQTLHKQALHTLQLHAAAHPSTNRAATEGRRLLQTSISAG